MADKVQLALLNYGTEVWNAWRRVNLSVYIDLRKADLQGAELQEIYLFKAHLQEAHLQGADLRGAYLQEAHLRGAHLQEAHLQGVYLQEAHLQEADLREAHLQRADLREAHLQGADLQGVHLQGADLTRAGLRGANLQGANLQGADLHGADLHGADLTGADLRGADLSQANLQEVDLRGAFLRGANLEEVNLNRSLLDSTIFANIDLSTAYGLESVQHGGPSTIGIDTLYLSQGKIPEAFLRGCGVPEQQIEYLPSLMSAMQPIQYHSCFISYSHQDESFAQRLHERMRAANLRVWYAPEEMKGGEKIYEQIDQAIQLHDRLLVVLSDASLQSEWVKTEIRKARKVEQQEGRHKLFPIRLTEMPILEAWKWYDGGIDIAQELREYFIPDFSIWKEHDAFEAAFTRLYNDLKASTKSK